MPIYEYRCQKCENVFEEWLKNFDEAAPECPQCGGQTERIMSNTTFVLKGGGWYVTEYGNHKGEGGPVSAAHGDTAAGQGGTGQGGDGQSGAGQADTAAKSDSKAQADNKAPSTAKTESASTKTSAATKSASSEKA